MTKQQTVPATLLEFQAQFSTDEACEQYLVAWRWPGGFRCPRCDHDDAVKLAFRRQWQCRKCAYQASVTAGTAMHKSQVGLRKWFWAIFLVARHKKSISALQLQRDLGIGSYRTAWLMLQKIRRAFGESADFPLKDVVEVDETLIGAKEKGAPTGKDPHNKAIVVGAVQLGKPTPRGHKWKDARLLRIPDYSAASLGSFVRANVMVGSTLITDGWKGYNELERTGYKRITEVSSHVARKDMHKVNPMKHIHLLFSNLKTWLRGRFHGVTHRYLQNYLDEFIYRLNRRHDPPSIFGWIVRRLTSRPHVSLAMMRSPDIGA